MTISEVDEVVEVELVNYFITGNIALTKVDKDYPENKLTGAVFEVYSDTNEDGKLDKKDELLGEMGEVGKGVYQMDDLRYGRYLVRGLADTCRARSRRCCIPSGKQQDLQRGE